MWNNELDRIAFFHKNYATSVEEMEAASVAQIASQFKVPFWVFECYQITLPMVAHMMQAQVKHANTMF